MRLNLSKRGAGLSAGARCSSERQHSGRDVRLRGRGGLYFRKRLRKGDGVEQDLSPEQQEQARNLEFGAFLVEKATREGLTGPDDVISDDLIAEAAEELFGDATSPEARAAIAYVNDEG